MPPADSRLDMNYEESLGYLEARGFGTKPDLSRIKALVELLDHPERAYPVIHLAGTNGKSSTARMVGWILAAHGINTGVYTSPHLQTVRERFLGLGPAESVGHNYISADDFASLMSYLAPFVEQIEAERGDAISYFELTTAMAFEWMAQSAVAAGVFEAGMGGTWDATNVVSSDVAVITHVDVDHIKYLGSTPLENAGEKAGIIKEGCEIVSASQLPEVQSLLESVARETRTAVRVLGRDFHLRANEATVDGRAVTIQGIYGTYRDVFVRLHGGHQAINAAVAVATCEQFLGRTLDDSAVRKALDEVSSPGRMEVVRLSPVVILDGAHNPDGARALASGLVESFGRRNTTLVIAISRDKDIDGILELLLPLGDRAIFTASTSKPADPETIARAARGRIAQVKVIKSIHEAIDQAVAQSGPEEMILVTGSLYAVGLARDHLLGKIV